MRAASAFVRAATAFAKSNEDMVVEQNVRKSRSMQQHLLLRRRWLAMCVLATGLFEADLPIGTHH